MKQYLIISLVLAVSIGAVLPVEKSFSQANPEKQMRSDFCFKEEVYSSVSKDITDPKEIKGQYYLEYSGSLDAEKIAYHRYINQRFEKSIRSIAEILKDSKGKNFADLETQLRDPANSHLRTSNLSISLLCSFEKYSQFILENKDRFQVSPDNTLSPLDTAEQIATAKFQGDIWTQELEFSRKALDQAIATYDEIANSFIIHIKYQAIIKELDLLRRQMLKMTELISCLPSKFVNTSTTQCQ